MTQKNRNKDTQFKRIREQSFGHLSRIITDTLTSQLPPLPPDVWPWMEAVAWQDYTPAQKATLIETGYTLDMAHATLHYTPFNAAFRLEVGRRRERRAGDEAVDCFNCPVSLPPTPASLRVPFLPHDRLTYTQQRGPGNYVSTFSQSDLWVAATKQFDALAPATELPPAMQTWWAAVKALDEPARIYKKAIDMVSRIWRDVRTTHPQLGTISCNAYMLTVPEWVPMCMLPAKRRTALPAAIRQRAEAALESILTQPEDPIGVSDMTNFDRQQPLLPQLRQLLLPPITAYRLAGKDTWKEVK